ncbi:unnamed protein product, partial [Durusdinium trenchii]
RPSAPCAPTVWRHGAPNSLESFCRAWRLRRPCLTPRRQRRDPRVVVKGVVRSRKISGRRRGGSYFLEQM